MDVAYFMVFGSLIGAVGFPYYFLFREGRDGKREERKVADIFFGCPILFVAGVGFGGLAGMLLGAAFKLLGVAH